VGGGSVFISKAKLFDKEGEYQNCVLFSGYIIENNYINRCEK